MSMLSAIPYVGPVIDFATSRYGLPLVVAGGIVFFYEGVPIGPLRDIPYAGPALAGLVDGRVDRVYAAGQKAEAALWQEKLRLAAIAKAAEARSRQADIDAAAQEYVDRRRSDDAHIAALQDAIRTQKEDDLGPQDPKTGSICRTGISAGVSTRIDAVGR